MKIIAAIEENMREKMFEFEVENLGDGYDDVIEMYLEGRLKVTERSPKPTEAYLTIFDESGNLLIYPHSIL